MLSPSFLAFAAAVYAYAVAGVVVTEVGRVVGWGRIEAEDAA